MSNESRRSYDERRGSMILWIVEDHIENDEWWKQKIILWMMNDESERSYYEGWMMKAEDHIMNDECCRRSYHEWWMMKVEDHPVNDESRRSMLWMMNDESGGSSCEWWMQKIKRS